MRPKRTDAWVQWALEAWERGEALEDILAHVPPSARQDVIDALETARMLRAYAADVRREAETWQPRWADVATRLAAEQTAADANPARGWARWASRAVWRWAALAAVLVFALAGMVLPAYAAQALPGDVLYPVKRWSEQVEGWFVARSPEGQQRWALELARRRMDEAEALLRQGRRAEAQRVLEEAEAHLRELPAKAAAEQRTAALRARWRALQRAAQGPAAPPPTGTTAPSPPGPSPAQREAQPTPPERPGTARAPQRTTTGPRNTPAASQPPPRAASRTPSPTATPREASSPRPSSPAPGENGRSQGRGQNGERRGP